MNPSNDCERVRLLLMAARDGEAVPEAADPHSDLRRHLASCAACDRWVKDFESMTSRFQGVSYVSSQGDLWPSVESRLRRPATTLSGTPRFWVIGAVVLGWRAVELLIDLPFPILHPLVPLAIAVTALWLIARDPLAIETFAPELQKRGL